MFAGNETIAGFDDDLASAIDEESRRQEEHIELIASENYASPRVLEAQGSVLTNKYAEGYPHKRYYGGCEFVDVLAGRAGVGGRVAAITERAMRGEIDFNQSFKERLGLLQGLSSDVLDELLNTLPFVEGGRELMLSLRSLGIKTVIVSGGFDIFASHVASVLGMDGYLANTLAIADKRLTGEVILPIVNADTKREQLLTLAHDLGVTAEQSIAVGDGANDLAMLGAAGLGVAFHAKPVVRAQADYQVSHTGLDSLLYFLGHRGELA